MKATITTLLLLALCACASQPSGTDKLAKDDPACLKDTGTRIDQHGGCTGAPGRSYSQEDIRRSGAFSTSEALQKLDPAVRSH